MLPIDPSTGRANNPARDSALQGFAGQIPNVVLPMCLGGAIKWFPNHLQAFNTFYIVGGVVSIAAWWIMALLVHPPNEKPGREWQCTRHVCHGDDDPWYQEGGALAGQENPRKASRSGGRAGKGAVLCDELLFGKGIYSAAARATAKVK